MKFTTPTLFIASLAACVAGQGGVTQIADGQAQMGKAPGGQQAVGGSAGSREAAGQAGAHSGSPGARGALPLDIPAAAAQGQAAVRISPTSGSTSKPAFTNAQGNAAEHAQVISSAPGPLIVPSIPASANMNAPPAGLTPGSGSSMRQIADGQVQMGKAAGGQQAGSGSAGSTVAGIGGVAGQAGAQSGAPGAPGALPLDKSAATAQGQEAAMRISSASGSTSRPATGQAQIISSPPRPVVAPSIPAGANMSAPPARPALASGSPVRQIADGQVQVPKTRASGLPGQQAQAHGRNNTGPAGAGAGAFAASSSRTGSGPLETPMAFKGTAAGRYVSTVAAAVGVFAFAFAMV